MPFMYILECDKGKYYTGSTKNLEKRMIEHWTGEGANYTRKHKPVQLVYVEKFRRVDDAFFREKQVQNWSHQKKKALFKKEYIELHKLAAGPLDYALGPDPKVLGPQTARRTDQGTKSAKMGIPMSDADIKEISASVRKCCDAYSFVSFYQ